MHEQDIAIVKALVPVAWSDGVFAQPEREMIDAVLEAYGASDKDKEMIVEYAATRRTLDDIELQELSADDRRVLFQHAVLLSFADGRQSPEETAFLRLLAKKLKLSDADEAALMKAGEERAKKYLKLL